MRVLAGLFGGVRRDRQQMCKTECCFDGPGYFGTNGHWAGTFGGRRLDYERLSRALTRLSTDGVVILGGIKVSVRHIGVATSNPLPPTDSEGEE